MVTAKPSDEAALSVPEVTARIRAMSEADRVRFVRASNYFSFGGARSPPDLRQEAIRRAIDGTRKCPRDISIVVFLRGVMRSIAWADRKCRARTPKLGVVAKTGTAGQSAPDIVDPRLSPEEGILQQDRADEIKRRILDLFDDDTTARLLADGMMDGLQGAELRELLELTEIEFASKRRLVRRRIDAAFPNGWRP